MLTLKDRIFECSDVCLKSCPSVNIREIWNKGFIKRKNINILRQISNKINELTNICPFTLSPYKET